MVPPRVTANAGASLMELLFRIVRADLGEFASVGEPGHPWSLDGLLQSREIPSEDRR